MFRNLGKGYRTNAKAAGIRSRAAKGSKYAKGGRNEDDMM